MLKSFWKLLHNMPVKIKVKEAMISPVITGKTDQTVIEAAKIMKENGVGSIIILENEKPVSIVTREDIVNKVTALDKRASEVTVKEIQSNGLIFCSPENDISEAARLMSKHKFERIPVISNGKVVGIISTREIARVAPAILDIATEHLRINEPPRLLEENTSGECQLCGNYSEKLHQVNDQWICDTCQDKEF